MFFAQIDQLKDVASGNDYTIAGVALLMLGAIAFLLWKIMSWFGTKLDKVVDRGFVHLDTVDDVMRSLKDSLRGMEDRLARIETSIEVTNRRIDTFHDSLKKEYRLPG
jgi:hypothetical protein